MMFCIESCESTKRNVKNFAIERTNFWHLHGITMIFLDDSARFVIKTKSM